MKKTLQSLFLLFASSGFSQTTPDYVTVDTDKFTIYQLVENLWVNPSLSNISNVTSSASCGIGYFNSNDSDFPFKEGMIISCGQAKNTEGKYNASTGNSSSCSNAGDAELQAINITQTPGLSGPILDASSVKFIFVANGNKFSFRYLFASNEYGQYQCDYGDAFAFILTDLTSNPGSSKNLGVVPGTTTPVLVTNIHKKLYNGACVDEHPEFFGQYNESPAANIAASDINMRGQTVVLTASADVIPNHPYSLKMVIGDYIEDLYDSAVFIEAGSFDFGQSQLGLNEVAVSNLTYSPNPVKDVLNIQAAEVVESVSVSNMLGQELFRGNYNNSVIQTDMSAFPVGTYFVKVQAGYKSSVFKIIKE